MPREQNRRTGLKRVFHNSKWQVFGQPDGWTVMNIALAEFMGTAILVFLGCMGIISGMGEKPSHFQIALTFGAVVGTVIAIIGHITAAHINPAVTAAAVVLGKINIPMAVLYIVSQCLGGIVGYGLLLVLTPDRILNQPPPEGVCCAHCVTIPHPEMTSLQAVLAEGLVTAVLILVVCSVWDRRNAKTTDSVPIKFIFTIFAVAAAEGPYTGGSMNPARSLGPAVWTGVWTQHWVYWIGPLSGAIIAAAIYRWVFDNDALAVVAAPEDVPLTGINDTKELQASNRNVDNL